MRYEFDRNTMALKFTFDGDVLSTNVREFRQRAFEALDGPEFSGCPRVELDLRAANIIDSAGLNLLVSIVRRAERKHARVSALISSENIRRTFSITRLDRFIEVQTTAGNRSLAA